jgi:hypothetical protein
MAPAHDAISDFLAAHGIEDATETGEDVMGLAIDQAVAEAGERVEAANLTPEQRMAKALAAELRGQVIAGASGEDVVLDVPPSAEETHEMNAWLDDDEGVYYALDQDGQYMTDENREYIKLGLHEDG